MNTKITDPRHRHVLEMLNHQSHSSAEYYHKVREAKKYYKEAVVELEEAKNIAKKAMRNLREAREYERRLKKWKDKDEN